MRGSWILNCEEQSIDGVCTPSVECSPAPGWNGCGITAARTDSSRDPMVADAVGLALTDLIVQAGDNLGSRSLVFWD
jgi:hypothetical protein